MAYRVVLDLSQSPSTIYKFKKDKVDLPMSESFIPATGDRVVFKHEGIWWAAVVDKKTTAIIPDPTSPKYCRTYDVLVTLTLNTCWEERYEPQF